MKTLAVPQAAGRQVVFRALFGSVLVVSGCAAAPGLFSGTRPVGLAAAAAENFQSAPARAAATFGTLWLRIRWSQQSLPRFDAQVIPLRTQSIEITITNSQGATAYQQVFASSSGSTEASASVVLPAGSGYGVQAQAFDVAAPTAASVPIAQGNAADVPIQDSKITVVPITLTAAYAPAITSLSVPQGPYGTTVALGGTDFGLSLDLPFQVSFGGVLAASPTRSSDTAITAIVPSGATSGDVVVTVDGVPSTSVALFTVTEGLGVTIEPLVDTYGPNGFAVTVQ